MTQNDFLNFDELQSAVVQRKPSDPNVRFKDARRFMFRLEYREGYFMTTSYRDNAPATAIRLMKGRANYSARLFNLENVPLRQKYDAPVPLKKSKVKDLQALLAYIPPSNSAYLTGITTQQLQLPLQSAHSAATSRAQNNNTMDPDDLDNDLIAYMKMMND